MVGRKNVDRPIISKASVRIQIQVVCSQDIPSGIAGEEVDVVCRKPKSINLVSGRVNVIGTYIGTCRSELGDGRIIKFFSRHEKVAVRTYQHLVGFHIVVVVDGSPGNPAVAE
jgi:hypothetical protein